MSETSTSVNRPRTVPETGAASRPPAGQFVGQYLLEEKLGEGGMGSVYRAIHVKLKKPFAVKVLSPGHHPSAALIERFHHEMEAIGRLEHPNLVRATDAGEHDGKYFLVMEYVEGQDLGKILNVRKTLSVPEACAVARQAAEGLQYLSDRKLVHRDIKPSNLLLTPDGQVKILDLGLALLQRDPVGFAEDEELTNPGQVMGTWDYIAPEQSKDSHQVDIRADIYSLGCTLYKLLAGRPPFSGSSYASSKEKVRAHQETPIPPIRSVRPDIPEAVERVLDKMLAKRPEDRYQQPRDVAQALATFAGGTDLARMLERAPASGATGDTDKLSRPGSLGHRARAIGMWTVVGLALMGAALAAAVIWLPRPPQVDPQPKQEPPRIGHWQALLGDEPVALHWSRNISPFVWNKTRAELLLSPQADLGIVGVGVVPPKPDQRYRYRVTLRQAGWIGNVGIVFGFQETDVNGQPGVKYQSIGLVRHGDGGLYLQRSRTERVRKGAGRTLLPVLKCSLAPPPHDEETLEILVHGKHLLQARWAGQELPELCAKKGNDPLSEADYAGALGVYAHNNMAVFRDAQVMYLER